MHSSFFFDLVLFGFCALFQGSHSLRTFLWYVGKAFANSQAQNRPGPRSVVAAAAVASPFAITPTAARKTS
jgi:hypothetical protein